MHLTELFCLKVCFYGNFLLFLHKRGTNTMAMKFYTEEEALDKVIGTKETAERIEYDARMDEFLIGEAIRQASKAKTFPFHEYQGYA